MMCTALSNTYISATRTICLGVVSIAHLVEVTDSTVLGEVGEFESRTGQNVKIYQQT